VACRLWFEFLKRSDYSTASPIYKDFGNVRAVSFDEWFDKKRWLFFQVPVPAVRLVETGDEDRFVVEVDLSQPRATIMRAFKRSLFIAKHSRGERWKKGRPKKHSRQYLRKAQYRFYRQPHIPSLQTILAVDDLRKAEPKLKLWEIGERLRLNREQVTKPTDTPAVRTAKRAVMTAYVSRYLRWAKALKGNVVKGTFPKTS